MTIINELRLTNRDENSEESEKALRNQQEEYSKCRGNRYGKVLPQKIHFRVQKMVKKNFLKTKG